MDWTDTVPKCDKHSLPCLLKTGMREGPTHLKSFFICSQLNDSCSFSQKASGVHPVHCQMHEDHYVDLQSIVYSTTLKEKRKFYRCSVAVKNKMKWCGFENLVSKDPTIAAENAEHPVIGASSQDRNTNPVKRLSGSSKDNSKFMSAGLDTKLKNGSVVENQNHKKSLQSLENLPIKSQTDAVKDKIAKEAALELPINSFESLSVNDDTSKKTATFRTAEREHPDAAKSAQDNFFHKQKKLPVGFAKASSLLPVNTTSVAVNNSMSYRDSSVVLISDSEEEDDDADDDGGSSKKNCKEGGDADDDVRRVDKIECFNNLSSETTCGADLPNGRVRSSSDALSNIIVLKNNGQSSCSVSSLKPSSVIVLEDCAESINPELKLLSATQLYLKNEELTKTLTEYQKLLKSVRGLPDGGQKIADHIVRLTKEKSQCEYLLKECRKNSLLEPSSSAVSDPNSDKGPMRQTKLIEFPTDLSSHTYQQMFGATNHGNLYGGRMTARRLEHVGHVTSEAIEQLHSQFESCPSSEQEASDPDGLLVPLLRHQRQALTWLVWREEQHPSGGILADDMGLGKTLTMISLILARRAADDKLESDKNQWLKKDSQKKIIKSAATLVICPASLVHQWQKEIERRVKRKLLRVIVYHGANREANCLSLASADVVITTYNLISKEVGVPEGMKKNKQAQEMPVTDEIDEISTDDSSLLRIFWNRIIIDEAHAIKNYKSLTAMSVSRLRSASRWALTGTPIHNDLLDMYSLLRFLRCSPFDEYKLWKRQVDNKTEKGTQRLNTLIKTLLLRRTKDQTCPSTGHQLVALPKKHSRSHELQLSRQERQTYEHIYKLSKAVMQQYLQRHEDKALGRDTGSVNSKPTNPWSKDDHRQLQKGSSASLLPLKPEGGAMMPLAGQSSSGGLAPSAGGQILINLLRLRQCCSHLFLLKNALEADDIQSDGMELDLVEQMNDLALKEAPGVKDVKIEDGQSLPIDINSPSTKITALLTELCEIRNHSSTRNPIKSVVVSQWTKMLDIVEFHLKREGFRCCTIKGSVPAKQRSDLVDTFNSDPSGPEVMLVSLRAGGVGLNLIGGSHLFVIDMHWNPALELQACDRIYRVGQQREVFIHRFICKDTIEEKIIRLQNSKTALANNILSGNSSSNNKLTLDDLRMLFGIGIAAEYMQHGYTSTQK